MSNDFSWKTFTVRIPVNASLEKLYSLWTSASAIEYWFLRECVFSRNGKPLEKETLVQTGDEYVWRWHGYPDEVKETGTILEMNDRDSITFSFGEAGICKVTIYREGEYNIVELEQRNVPEDDWGKHNYHVGCKTGWTFHLTNMKAIIEANIDLRNKDLSLKNVINA